MHDTDRRRLLLAAIVTLIAVPAFFIISRSGDDGSEPAGTDPATAEASTSSAGGNVINPLPEQQADAGNVINPVATEQTDAATTEPPPGSQSQLPQLEAPDDDPIFMNGPVAIEEDEIAEVAIPAQPSIPPITIEATYLSTIPGTRSCLVRGVTSGRTVRVTNLDNGRSITCVTVLAPRTQGDELIMHRSAFEQLADLTDAPIAVEVSQ